MFRSACSLWIVACLTLSAAADMPPPPPAAGLKRVPYEIVMKLKTELPTYQFYTFQRLGIGGQEIIHGELKLDPENAVAVPSTSSPSIRTGVIAVPKSVMAQLETQENLAKLLSPENKDRLPAGVVVFETRGTIRDLKQSDPRSKVVKVITVSLDEEAGVRFTDEETPQPTNQDSSVDPSSRSRLASVVAGIASSVAIVMLVVWQVRRKQRRPVSP